VWPLRERGKRGFALVARPPQVACDVLRDHAQAEGQAVDVAATRADASLAYTLNMIGFGLGAVVIGGLIDRFGIVGPLIVSTLTLTVGFLASGLAPTLMVFTLANFLVGIGSSGVFAPLIADISHWFTRRRGIAVAVCSSGNYIGGAVWPPIVQHFIETEGWRQNQILIGFACLLIILPLLLVLRPFLEERGPLSFAAMRKLLHRRLPHPGFARYLDRQRDIFKGRRLTRSKALSDVRLPQSDQAIEKWLGDPSAASSQAPWTTDAIKALAIVLLLEKSRAIIDVADAIFAIRTGAVVVPLPGDH